MSQSAISIPLIASRISPFRPIFRVERYISSQRSSTSNGLRPRTSGASRRSTASAIAREPRPIAPSPVRPSSVVTRTRTWKTSLRKSSVLLNSAHPDPAAAALLVERIKRRCRPPGEVLELRLPDPEGVDACNLKDRTPFQTRSEQCRSTESRHRSSASSHLSARSPQWGATAFDEQLQPRDAPIPLTAGRADRRGFLAGDRRPPGAPRSGASSRGLARPPG